jgi:nucleoid DNA-binding protein
MSKCLSTKAGQVHLFGETSRCPARSNPNTRTGFNVPEKHFATFKPGKPMHHRLNG